MTGLCDCPAGWSGSDCATEQKRPCSADDTSQNLPGSQPSSHIGPDKRDLNWTQGGWTASRCGGVCDDDKGLCYCDGEHGRIPAPPGSPPGTPPVRAGRPLGDWCQPSMTYDGKKAWGSTPYEKMYGPNGWCNVSVGVEPMQMCGCDVDGLAGQWCELTTEQFCVNSCSGHGRCDNGFCHCQQGWFGHDCAGRAEGQQPDPAGNNTAVLRERPWLAGHLVPPVAAALPAEGATRKRPFIYVYDVPAYAAARMLQYRGPKSACVWRYFQADNITELNGGWLYPADTLLHEMLLQSSHRTLDPEEADFFYVPAYITCFMWPIHGWADYPWWHVPGAPRPSHMTKMLLELKRHIQQHYPYWNRTQGADHIWTAFHDEGACYMPTEIYNSSIILTHWGRMDLNHTSNTAYGPDNYTADWDDTGQPPRPDGVKSNQWQELYKGHPCYTPGKDLVIPFPKFPAHYRWSPLLGAPPQKRTKLLYFRGDVGKQREPNYSRGIRQQLYNLAKFADWSTNYNISIGDREDLPGDYSLHLASSRFCLVAPGDGFSARAEDAVLHGCVPVVIQDNVHAPLESILNWKSFSLRVAESEMTDLPRILQAVPPQRLQQLQWNLQKVWHRFAYLSQPLICNSAEEVRQKWQTELAAVGNGAATNVDPAKFGQPDWGWMQELQALDEKWLAEEEHPHHDELQQQAAAQTGMDEDDMGPASAAAIAASETSNNTQTAGTKEEKEASNENSRSWQELMPNFNSTGLKPAVNNASLQAPSNIANRTGNAGAAALSFEELAADDAFSTLIQWLYFRMLQRQHQQHHHQQQLHAPVGHHKVHTRHGAHKPPRL